MDSHEFELELESLKEDGSIKSIDEQGMISFDFEKLAILHPALHELVWQDVMQEIDQTVRDLEHKGYLQSSFRITEDGKMEEVFGLTERGTALVEELRGKGEIPPLDML